VIRYLVESETLKFDIEQKNSKRGKHRFTPIFTATSSLEICKYYIEERKLKIKEQLTNLLATPLHFAAMYGNTKTCDYFLENNFFDIECRDVDGWTPLHYCVQNKDNLECVRLLVEKYNANIYALNYSFQSSVLYISCQKDENYEIVKYLLKRDLEKKKNGSSLSLIPNKHLWTPLHIASKCGNTNIIKLLLEEYNADLEAKTNLGYTPISVAKDITTCYLLFYKFYARIPTIPTQFVDIDDWKKRLFESFLPLQERRLRLIPLLLLL